MSNQQDVLTETKKVIPVSFWRHFADDETIDALKHPEENQINIEGHKAYTEAIQPDFVKLMSDGYFNLPLNGVNNPKNIDDLKKIQVIADDDDWLLRQVDLVKAQRKVIGNRKAFYNIFSPVTLLKWALFDSSQELPKQGDERLTQFFIDYPDDITHILEVIAQGVIKQIKAVVNAGGADGVYYSTQELQSDHYNRDLFDHIQKKIDLSIIAVINAVSDVNILHICGYSETKNHLSWFTDYDLPIVNWAVKIEDVSLREGQAIFKDKIVLGGFGNNTQDILYRGSREEIEAEVTNVLTDVDTSRVIIGADCTVPRDISIDHLKWAIAAVHQVAIG
ncbi:uroporphyrinogen decarboxylase family protein [Leuconostoc kimchii]|uniref:Uroporphyrinogen decarboxylase n=1 Tax=Leuconostoc kimchii TaxID=136609 RepID=A0ABX5SLR1_9LACO|nr:uroporphyrinogen decarboxylase family protein [Leuconostoc kimchii]QBR48315.1 uroporphyrinogen decarboxylase [Leuconostoc kimchii]